jgi:hypothetical protein
MASFGKNGTGSSQITRKHTFAIAALLIPECHRFGEGGTSAYSISIHNSNFTSGF